MDDPSASKDHFVVVCRVGDIAEIVRASLLACAPVVQVGAWRALPDDGELGEITYVVDHARLDPTHTHADLRALRTVAIHAIEARRLQTPPAHLRRTPTDRDTR